MKSKVIIANSSGFWGDDPDAARRQVDGGPIDYLVMDFLAEVTMAILQKQKARKPEAGYAADFVTQLRDVLPACVDRGIRIISNAGGVNPLGCRAAVQALATELGLRDRVKVAVVLGDDLFPQLDEVIASGERLLNMDTGKPVSEVRANVLSANAYLGAGPIAKALELGANVVVTGRVADAAVTLGPLMFEFGWKADDWDRLAAGIAAGHIIECGAQATGGNFTDWHLVKSFRNIGFPIVEVAPDGSFVVTKHPNTGGLVSVHTVSEQIVYEIGGPEYLTPDVVARFDTIRLEQEGPDRVRVSGVRGEPAPERLKVSVSYHAGWRAFGRLIVSGPDTLAKANAVADAVWDAAGGRDAYDDAVQQFIGWNGCHPPLAASEPSEVLVQLAVRDTDERKISTRFAPQVVPRALSTVPGISYVADQGRPRTSEVVAFWPALISRAAVSPRVITDAGEATVEEKVQSGKGKGESGKGEGESGKGIRERETGKAPDVAHTIRVPLSRLCLARSGDKGDTANIGVIARSEAIYGWIVENLTTAFVKRHFGEICEGEVERFVLPNLLALNFLLHHSLGGGGAASLLLDAQGKTYAQFLLAAEVDAPESLINAAPAHTHRQQQLHV